MSCSSCLFCRYVSSLHIHHPPDFGLGISELWFHIPWCRLHACLVDTVPLVPKKEGLNLQTQSTGVIYWKPWPSDHLGLQQNATINTSCLLQFTPPTAHGQNFCIFAIYLTDRYPILSRFMKTPPLDVAKLLVPQLCLLVMHTQILLMFTMLTIKMPIVTGYLLKTLAWLVKVSHIHFTYTSHITIKICLINSSAKCIYFHLQVLHALGLDTWCTSEILPPLFVFIVLNLGFLQFAAMLHRQGHIDTE